MTLIECTAFALALVGAVAGAICGGKYGLFGGISGFVLGGVSGYLVYCVFWSAVVVLIALYELPGCRVGDMRGKHVLRRKSLVAEGSIWVCDCSKVYLKTRWRVLRSTRFLEVSSDGSLHPYKKRKPFRKWENDEDTPPAFTLKSTSGTE